MKSFFYELEQELYNLINSSPISLDGKYFLIKDIYHSIEMAYKSYLSMPDEKEYPQEKKENNNETIVETTVDEDGQINIKAEGKNIGETISKAFNAVGQANNENKE